MVKRRQDRWGSVAIASAVVLTAAFTVWIASGLVDAASEPQKPPRALNQNEQRDRAKPRPYSPEAAAEDSADALAGTDSVAHSPLKLPTSLADSSVEAVVRVVELRNLLIPVAGIRPDQLTDTYTQARSEGRIHNAIDIMAPLGAAVVAVTRGTVIRLFESVRGGTTLYLLDDDGRTVYYYAHLDRYADGIQEGRRVRRGDIIAYVGDTGNAAPGEFHLHFEITIVDDPKSFYRGTSVNPYPILTRRAHAL